MKNKIKIIVLLFLTVQVCLAKPTLFELDQVHYFYHGNSFSENRIEYFHEIFKQTYEEVFAKFKERKVYPIRVEIFTNTKEFQEHTKLLPIYAGLYTPKEGFIFLLTPKTMNRDRLIQIISHESCHALLDLTNEEIDRVLEEGFCSNEFPSEEFLYIWNRTLLNLELEKFLETGNWILKNSSQAKKRDVYHAATLFIRSIRKTKNTEEVLKLLRANSLRNLNKYWHEFTYNQRLEQQNNKH